MELSGSGLSTENFLTFFLLFSIVMRTTAFVFLNRIQVSYKGISDKNVCSIPGTIAFLSFLFSTNKSFIFRQTQIIFKNEPFFPRNTRSSKFQALKTFRFTSEERTLLCSLQIMIPGDCVLARKVEKSTKSLAYHVILTTRLRRMHFLRPSTFSEMEFEPATG